MVTVACARPPGPDDSRESRQKGRAQMPNTAKDVNEAPSTSHDIAEAPPACEHVAEAPPAREHVAEATSLSAVPAGLCLRWGFGPQ